MVILYNIAVSKTRASDFKLTCAFYEKHFHTCEKKSIIAVKQQFVNTTSDFLIILQGIQQLISSELLLLMLYVKRLHWFAKALVSQKTSPQSTCFIIKCKQVTKLQDEGNFHIYQNNLMDLQKTGNILFLIIQHIHLKQGIHRLFQEANHLHHL